MEELQRLAEISVARGCGFAALGIACAMIGFAHDPLPFLKVGGVLTLMLTVVLMHRANTALSRPYKTTELWLMLDPGNRPAEAYAQWVFGTVLREAYLRFAYIAARISVGLWVLTALVSLLWV